MWLKSVETTAFYCSIKITGQYLCLEASRKKTLLKCYCTETVLIIKYQVSLQAQFIIPKYCNWWTKQETYTTLDQTHQKNPQYKAKSRWQLIFTVSLQKGLMLPNIKCISCSDSLHLPSKRQNQPHRWNWESTKMQWAEYKDNLKGKYMLGFSPVILYRVFYQYIFTAQFYMRKMAGFQIYSPEMPCTKKDPISLAMFKKNNVFAAKYC